MYKKIGKFKMSYKQNSLKVPNFYPFKCYHVMVHKQNKQKNEQIKIIIFTLFISQSYFCSSYQI